MLIAAIIFFSLAALGGLTMAYLRLRSSPIPLVLAMGHGTLALIGIIFLLIDLFRDTPGYHGWALLLFLLAAGGGLYMFNQHRRHGSNAIPVPIIFVHGPLALVGLVLLLLSI
jgi:hypothetical protein